MAAGPITIRMVDTTGLALAGWQCLKAPVGVAETALTAAKLLDDMRTVSAIESTVEVIPVAMFDMIQIMVLANGTADQSPVLDLYGWGENGPGHHIGTLTTDISTAAITAVTGFHADPKTHTSIRTAFAASIAWKICDQYVVTLDTEQERLQDDLVAQNLQYQSFRALNVRGIYAFGGVIGTSPTQADFPQMFNVDLSHSAYSYFGLLPTALDSATSVGAIFRMTKMKERL